MKLLRTIWIPIVILSACLPNSSCDSVAIPLEFENDDLLDRLILSEFLQYNKTFTALQNLSYQSKCNFELEEIGAEMLEETLVPLLKNITPSEVGDPYILNEDLVAEIEVIMAAVKIYSGNITNSTEGGLCNAKIGLYCDKTSQKCSCGQVTRKDGYLTIRDFIMDANRTKCRSDLGSGCDPVGVELASEKCHPATGSAQCLTSITFDADLTLHLRTEWRCRDLDDVLRERVKKAELTQIKQNLTSLKSLDYRDSCNVDLEGSSLELLNERLVPFLKNILPLKGKAPGPLTEELVVDIENVAAALGVLVRNLTNSEEGGLCNATRGLYCDQRTEQCLCGEQFKDKGFFYVLDPKSAECRFDVDSGCNLSELEHVALPCRDGTSCVTILKNQPCDLENLKFEVEKFPEMVEDVVEMKGYACFCKKNVLY